MRIQSVGSGLLVHTPAKLNLNLRVLGRRPDGFHELQTLFVSIGLYDTLEFTRGEPGTIELAVHCPRTGGSPVPLPADSRNLVVRAAELLRSTAGAGAGARIVLRKRIPAEAGLGGGSSDAAATLVALNQLWALGLSPVELHPLAAQLGSDVNFFLDSLPAALGRGRGEILAPVSLPLPLHFVVVKPPTGLSTREVFARLAPGTLAPTSSRTEPAEIPSLWLPSIGRLVQNDLEPAARELSKDVDRLLDRLRRESVVAAAMTGSGSACFALCRNRRHARKLAQRLRSENLGETFCVSTSV